MLCLFEGVATGAADGYGRMAGHPAATLLHLGPGLANGLANLHNARRARTPLLNVVGDHALSHKRFDAPLESDIDSLARSVSGWVRRSVRSADVAPDAAEAVAAALGPPGGVATLILPADVSWSDGARPAPRSGAAAVRGPGPVIEDAARALAAARGTPPGCVILLGGAALRRPGLRPRAGSPWPAGHGCCARRSPPGWNAAPACRGWNAWPIWPSSRVAAGRDHPADPGGRARPGVLLRLPGLAEFPGTGRLPVHTLAAPGEDVCGALADLAERVAPGARPQVRQRSGPRCPPGN